MTNPLDAYELRYEFMVRSLRPIRRVLMLPATAIAESLIIFGVAERFALPELVLA
jgi:hypothetical protein